MRHLYFVHMLIVIKQEFHLRYQNDGLRDQLLAIHRPSLKFQMVVLVPVYVLQRPHFCRGSRIFCQQEILIIVAVMGSMICAKTNQIGFCHFSVLIYESII